MRNENKFWGGYNETHRNELICMDFAVARVCLPKASPIQQLIYREMLILAFLMYSIQPMGEYYTYVSSQKMRDA